MFSPSIPRPKDKDIGKFRMNPLAFLFDVRQQQGDIAVLVEGSPIFSRAQDCAGCIAAFGIDNIRRVLTHLDVFGMPVSVAERFSLPPTLVKLNSGLFSMSGDKHRHRQQLLDRLLDSKITEEFHSLIAEGCATFLERWRIGQIISLLSEMRQFVLHVSSRFLFGRSPDALKVGSLIQDFFSLRREYAVGQIEKGKSVKADLICLGHCVDEALRRLLRNFRRVKMSESSCLLARLSRLECAPGRTLTDDELVAHGNVLFMSSSEPVVAALTWTFLLLSQIPKLRRELRRELEQASVGVNVPRISELQRLPLLVWVVRESLRMLPPNAIMVRLTTRPTVLQGHELPENCEVLLSPYVSHRDPVTFPQPDTFYPRRWLDLKPSPFEYFPFGAGGRYCLGRSLATYTIMTALAIMIRRYDLVLAGDQEIDWKMSVTLMPSTEPLIQILSPFRTEKCFGGHLQGAVAELVNLKTNT